MQEIDNEQIEILKRYLNLESTGKTGVLRDVPESEQIIDLVEKGYLARKTRPAGNVENAEFVVGHDLTDKARKLLGE